MVSWKSASAVIIMSKTTQRVLMMVRGATAKFMPNAIVFPGGVVAPTDEALGEPSRVAALREVFEETGLLVTPTGIKSAAERIDLAKAQDILNKDVTEFENISKEPYVDSLIKWSVWLTPAHYEKRYLTNFFVLLVEGEPPIRMCQKEMAGYRWEAPALCLEKAFVGELILPPPQVYELTKLSQLKNKIAPLGDPNYTICPQSIRFSDAPKIVNVLPGDHLYINEDPHNQPARIMTSEELEITQKPTHRAEYQLEPLYTECQIFRHNLEEPYRRIFPKFRCHSGFFPNNKL